MRFYNLRDMFSWNSENPDKSVINAVLEYVDMPDGVDKWWITPVGGLHGKSPTQAWEENPELVWVLAQSYIDNALQNG